MADTQKQGGYIAGAAIERGDLIKLDTTNNYPYVIKTAADTDVVIGYATADAASGEAVQYETICGNVHLVRASAAISEGDNIAPAADGEVKTAASGNQVCGQAMEAASGADVEFRCLLYHGWLLA